MRIVDDTGYPVLTKEYAQVHSLKAQPHHFDLKTKQRVKPTITLHARSHIDTHILVSSGNQQWHLNLLKSDKFATFELAIPLATSAIKIQNLQPQRKPIEYVMQSSQLLDLPNNELLYLQPGKLIEKSPIISQLLKDKLALMGDEYINTLVPYNPQIVSVKETQQQQVHWHNQLAKAHDLSKSDPLKSLQLLKSLVNATNPTIAIKAWQLRIALLSQQGRGVLAKSYLEGLYKSTATPTLKKYAVASNTSCVSQIIVGILFCPDLLSSIIVNLLLIHLLTKYIIFYHLLICKTKYYNNFVLQVPEKLTII